MSITDRELLELAAKAAGIVLGEHARFIGDHPQLWFYNDSRKHPMCRKPSRAGNVPWNPRTDDGDALRLAAALAMHINIEGMEIGYRIGGVLHVERIVLTDSGLEDAVRRAIFRAAAEIGKGMP